MKLKLLGAIVLTCLIVGMFLADSTTQTLIKFLPTDVSFVASNPTDGFMLIMNVGLVISIALFALLGLIWFWINYRDAFEEKEKLMFVKSIAPALILFIAGFVFALWLYFNIMLPYFSELNTNMGFKNLWSPQTTITNGLILALLLGLAFELPILIRGILKLGLVTKKNFTDKRGIVLFLICLIAAIITPTPDLLSMGIVAIPLYGLFEISLI